MNSPSTRLQDQAPPSDAAPGWKPDPLGSDSEREWDGEAWTTNVRGGKEPRLKGRSKLIAIGIGAALIGGVIGYAGASGETDEANERADKLERQLDDANSQISDFEAERGDLLAEVEQEKERFRRKKEAQDARADALDARAKSVDRREDQVASAEATIKRNTFSDGIWKVGTDFDPGTYRSTGGDCYWAKLSDASGNFDSIIANNNGSNQTVTIDSPYFESSGCGKWQKIG